MDITDVLTLAQAAEIAGVKNPNTLRAAVNRGDLPAAKFGKTWVITRKALQAWIDDPAMHKTGIKAK